MQLRCVPDDELAVGPDGKKLPFAIITKDSRRTHVEETGPFGKSRRGRNRSKTPAVARKEDPSLAAFDEAFRNDQARRAAEQTEKQEQQHGTLSRSSSQTSIQPQGSSTALATVDGGATSTTLSPPAHQEPTEVLLRGFLPGQSYGAIDLYERVGCGRICEDYARDPPTDQRRYLKAANFPARALTQAEKAKVNAYAGGEDWIKVTFESAEAADRAVSASPMVIAGQEVFAELYRGPPNPPNALLPAPVASSATTTGYASSSPTRRAGYAQSSGGDAVAPQAPAEGQCTKIPGARRIVLLPAEQALLPQQTFSQKWLSPYLGNWGDVIGDHTPRLEDGTFDYRGANLWWKMWYWADVIFRLHLIDD
ncbi:MAG: hypothetical protein M1832_002487 [Thelocarpon impressellum]|nr:MAG: hypothetical protein M1832_002487 [Thelocarpon impressellum]